MTQLFPTGASLLRPEFADRVPSPAYDSMTPAERRQYRLDNPESFLNVTRSPEDEPSGVVADTHVLLREGREALDNLVALGAFAPRGVDALFIYRLAAGDHVQTGIVGEIPVSEYESGEMRIHEEIRAARAALLADHFSIVGAVSSPVAVAFRGSPESVALVRRLTAAEPDLVLSDDRLTQTVWRIDNADDVAALCALLAPEPTYIIDGHHRAAASLEAARRRGTDAPDNHMLVALFPDNSLQLLGFNRWIRIDAAETAAALAGIPGLEPVDAQPEATLGTIGVYAAGRWYRAVLNRAEGFHFDAVAVRTQLLQPIFGIAQDDDPRLVNLAGDQPIADLVATVDAGGGIALVLAPIELDAFMAVADRGQVLPPKSTYFTPKARSGLFLRMNQ